MNPRNINPDVSAPGQESKTNTFNITQPEIFFNNFFAGCEAQLVPKHFEKLTQEHGLNIETIKQAGLFSANAVTLNNILNRNDIFCEGIVIPYSEGFSRVRLDVPLTLKNGKKAKYLSPSGSQNRLYIPPGLEKVLLKDPSTPLYITEGEFKALKLTQGGYLCIGLPGVWGFSREKKLLPDFDEIYLRGRKMIIVLDSDAGRKRYENAE